VQFERTLDGDDAAGSAERFNIQYQVIPAWKQYRSQLRHSLSKKRELSDFTQGGFSFFFCFASALLGISLVNTRWQRPQPIDFARWPLLGANDIFQIASCGGLIRRHTQGNARSNRFVGTESGRAKGFQSPTPQSIVMVELKGMAIGFGVVVVVLVSSRNGSL
jgi:hypothetical protein